MNKPPTPTVLKIVGFIIITPKAWKSSEKTLYLYNSAGNLLPVEAYGRTLGGCLPPAARHPLRGFMALGCAIIVN